MATTNEKPVARANPDGKPIRESPRPLRDVSARESLVGPKGRTPVSPAPAAKPSTGATAARVRRSPSRATTEATRALLAHADALAAKVALAASDTADSTRWALRYLEACQPTSVLPPALLSPADQIKLAYAEADQMVGVVRAVLEGLKLSDADYTRGIDLARDALRASAAQGWEPL